MRYRKVDKKKKKKKNGNYASVGTRDLHENFLPPFQEAIDAGALSVMTSYNSNGWYPCTANYYLLTQLPRNEWRFRGFCCFRLI